MKKEFSDKIGILIEEVTATSASQVAKRAREEAEEDEETENQLKSRILG